MLVRVKSNPDKLSTPAAVPLPTWGYVAEDIFACTMVVEIPDGDLPAVPDGMSEPVAKLTYKGPVLVLWHDEGHKLWHNHLDAKYKEHAGEFRPQMV